MEKDLVRGKKSINWMDIRNSVLLIWIVVGGRNYAAW